MKISKIIVKIKKYLADDSLAQTKQEKIIEIIEKLSIKKAKLRQDIKACDRKSQKEELRKEYEAISKLLNKSKSLI